MSLKHESKYETSKDSRNLYHFLVSIFGWNINLQCISEHMTNKKEITDVYIVNLYQSNSCCTETAYSQQFALGSGQ